MGRRTVIDANDLFKNPGISYFDFGTSTNISNIPEGAAGWGVFFSVTASNQSLQLCTDVTNNIWFRTADGSGIKEWKKFTFQ